ncbi:MAG: cystathionine gamma-synthase [Nitrospinae bacterium]|nr:cystathionine gamma-synthase [Nitrospinota bacterium]
MSKKESNDLKNVSDKNPLIAPLYQTASFSFKDTAELARFHNGEEKNKFLYSRFENPTTVATEAYLSGLEKSESSLLFSSGMAAITCSLISLLGPGKKLILPETTYRHTRDLADKILSKYGIEILTISNFNIDTLEQIEEKEIRVLFVEIPSNPLLSIPDIEKLSEWCHSNKVHLIVDSTIASPAILNPLEYGADLVIHSATKYLSGHNDIVAGSISASENLIDALKEQRMLLGSTLGINEAFLLHRGMKTLGIRMARISETALKLAEFLEGHKKIKNVFYPGLESHPDHSNALKYLKNTFGGLISFEMKDRTITDKFIDNLEVSFLAAGFGGIESQAEHHAKMAYPDLEKENSLLTCIPEGLIRFSVGLDDFEILRDDINQALGKC